MLLVYPGPDQQNNQNNAGKDAYKDQRNLLMPAALMQLPGKRISAPGNKSRMARGCPGSAAHCHLPPAIAPAGENDMPNNIIFIV